MHGVFESFSSVETCDACRAVYDVEAVRYPSADKTEFECLCGHLMKWNDHFRRKDFRIRPRDPEVGNSN